MSDLQELGKELERTISKAVKYGDFSNLSRDISSLASRAASSVERSMNTPPVVDVTEKSREKGGYRYDSVAGTMRDIKGRNLKNEDIVTDPDWQKSKTASYINRINREHRQEQRESVKRTTALTGSLYDKAVAKRILSILSMVVGYPAGIISLLVILIASVSNPWTLITMIIPGAFLGAAFWGTSNIFRLSRFDKYISALAGKTYADIRQLADVVGKTEKATLKDLRKMISQRLFLQGHIDAQETCLITSDKTYDQYLITQKQLIEQKEKKEKEEAHLTPQQKEIFKTGEEYLKEIQRCNDEIPGEVMSAKIDRMKKSVELIFDRAKKKPNLVEDLRRLMNYYLPTTVKLLNAYVDLDRQDKTSENIDKSKKEIEDTIDTLNDAFDRLFDDMFEDTSLDISTDAEVMKTLLEQEGLTGHNFTSNIKL